MVIHDHVHRFPFKSAVADRPDCGGSVLEHVDGTLGPCSRGTSCTGGDHTQGEECLGFPENCSYCRTLRCEHDVIEHATGAEECRGLGMECPPGSWHEGELLPCEDIYGDDHTCPPERPLPGPGRI